MEFITSRKNSFVRRMRQLESEKEFRRKENEFVCDGVKALDEALRFGAAVTSVAWRENALEGYENLPNQYCLPEDLFEYSSPLKNSTGPVFTVRIPEASKEKISRAIVLENVQDPGNVGTIIRTANAFEIDAVILTGACADLYNPKTVRATMGAIFRQRVIETDDIANLLEINNLPLYGAALSEKSVDIRNISVKSAAVAIGSEGRGLSKTILDMCREKVIIPMNPDSESLNAAMAASLIMWEMFR